MQVFNWDTQAVVAVAAERHAHKHSTRAALELRNITHATAKVVAGETDGRKGRVCVRVNVCGCDSRVAKQRKYKWKRLYLAQLW